jgi:DNA-binding IclR family transcriptional regulator
MSGRDSVKSAVRVLEILEYFARNREPTRLRDIVRSLGYPTSSTDVLLKTMVAQGYMQFDAATHCYMPSQRVAQLGSWIPVGGFEQTTILQHMYVLRNKLREPVVLATPNGIHLEYVESLPGFDGINSIISPGTKRLLVQTGTGWLFLNRLPLEDAFSIYRRTLRCNELSAAEFSQRDFLAKLEDHRGRDVSFVRARDLLRPTAHWNAAMVSMMIPSPPGHRPLALGVHGPCQRIEDELSDIECELLKVRAAIEAELEQEGEARPSVAGRPHPETEPA